MSYHISSLLEKVVRCGGLRSRILLHRIFPCLYCMSLRLIEPGGKPQMEKGWTILQPFSSKVYRRKRLVWQHNLVDHVNDTIAGDNIGRGDHCIIDHNTRSSVD